MDLNAIKLLILDVDGVLTSGQIIIPSDGEQIMKFQVQDGLAIKLWQDLGGLVAILSGRSSAALATRAGELGIGLVYAGVSDKQGVYDEIKTKTECPDGATVYVGDDLPDLPVMERVGFPVAVANALPSVKRASAYVTRRGGGMGAVAEVVEFILRKQGRWSTNGRGRG